MILTDGFNRVHDYLRVSLTDKCNLNCVYCNPAEYAQTKLKRDELLTYDELLRLINIFAGVLGIKKIRFTGGEPLVRKDALNFFESVYSLKNKYGVEIGLTTNGTLLEEKVAELKKLGVDKLNISLDSLKKEKYKYITGHNKIESVIKAIEKAGSLGFAPLKINVVVIKNINDDEVIDFVDFIKDKNMNVRFIEFMPFGNNSWKEDGFISAADILNSIRAKFNLIEIPVNKNLVARNYKIEGHTGTVSVISSISDHFCGSCNRLRITAEGKLKLCLFSDGKNEINFKELLRNNNTDDQQIAMTIHRALQLKNEKHPEVDELIKLEENNMLSIGG